MAHVMDPEVFRRFAAITYERAGIRLKEGKQALVIARLARRVAALGLRNVEEYLEVLEGDQTGSETVHYLNAISTNFTRFFREPEHFEWLSALVGRLLERGCRRMRLWSAACSSGEEAYSMAIVVAERALGVQLDFRVLATDISTRALERARAGIYDEAALQPVSESRRHAFFEQAPGSSGGKLRVRDELRERVVFKRLNLAAPPFPMAGPLDVVFCRNAMIYFDRPVREALLSEIDRLLAPHGLLATGHAETLLGFETNLCMLAPSLYGKRHSPMGR